MKYNTYLFITFLMIIMITHKSFSQRNSTSYWQQRADYNINIDINMNTHKFSGNEKIDYMNYSNDTLSTIYLHLYFNAFKPSSKMDLMTKSIQDPDARIGNKISLIEPWEKGNVSIGVFSQRVYDVTTQKYKNYKVKFNVDDTILKAELPEPIYPNDTCQLYLEFTGQIPIHIRRTGRNNKEGVAYTMAQWYPKIAEYDYEGWNVNDYVGREFYGVWGDYDVNIYIDNSYMVAGTGSLINANEIGYGYQTQLNKKYRYKEGEKHKWHFVARNVIDFAFVADPGFIHSKTQVPNGPELHFFYKKGSYSRHWDTLPQKIISTILYMSRAVGPYPYHQYSFIQGGDGGMSYPMCTIITSNRTEGSLTSVAIHELIHSWFQIIIANNELKYSWMDEGFTTYFATQIAKILQGNSDVNDQVGHQGYFSLVKSGIEEPASTHANIFKLNYTYGYTSYNKGAAFLGMLRNLIGESNFNAGMKLYYNDWAFKHPTPNDFIRCIEKASGINLRWYLKYMIDTTKKIDYKVTEIKSISVTETEITLERIGEFPMPLYVQVSSISDFEFTYYIPLDLMHGHKKISRNVTLEKEWSWVEKKYKLIANIPSTQILDVTIDPNNYIADVDRSNNTKKKFDTN